MLTEQFPHSQSTFPGIVLPSNWPQGHLSANKPWPHARAMLRMMAADMREWRKAPSFVVPAEMQQKKVVRCCWVVQQSDKAYCCTKVQMCQSDSGAIYLMYYVWNTYLCVLPPPPPPTPHPRLPEQRNQGVHCRHPSL